MVLPAITSYVSVAAAAGNVSDGLCEHHAEHTPQCGYIEGEEGHPCTYVCGICGQEADSEEQQKNADGVQTYGVRADNSRLDGDYAYISEAEMNEDASTDSGYEIRTGTAPWDDDDARGNDTGALNSRVRSFDTVSYTVSFQNRVREGSPYEQYRAGKLHFEFILPAQKEQAQFETGSMGWLTAKTEGQYDITESTYNGKPCQVLRGSYLWEPSDDNPSAVGESYQELTLVVRILQMKEGDTLQPEFTFWMDYNEVPSSGLVTGSGHKCSVHGVQEYKTITGPEVTVTSAPRYNVQLTTAYTSTQHLDTFDFSTGNELAQNKDAGVRYGRAQAFGVTLQIAGKPGQGLRGCEIPDGGPITFDLTLSSSYRDNNGKITDVSDTGYAPLLWSSEGNRAFPEQLDGRELSVTDNFAFLAAPFNAGGDYMSCNYGGIWNSVQSDNTIQVTVKNYEIDLNKLPDSNARDGGSHIYYDPYSVKGYWDVQTACFSAGEFWIVQPFYDEAGTYVVDKYGNGNFTLTVSDGNLAATGESGTSLDKVPDNSNQGVLTDDTAASAMALETPGAIGHYIRYHGTSITEAYREEGKDWSLTGAEINVQGQLAHLSAEGSNTGVAYDDLIKFDDAFFDIEGSAFGDTNGMSDMESTLLYGAKPDKTGWNHGGKAPAEEGYDTEMMEATADDLVFFTSLEELENQGYVCVALLWEARGIASQQSTEVYFTAEGRVRGDADSGSVYMVTHSAKAWNKKNVQEAAARYLGKEVSALTDEDYKQYVQSSAFPSRADQIERPRYSQDYPEAFWTDDYTNTAGLRNYEKSRYDENGYAGGSSGRNYGDSCLVTDYAARITKSPAQMGSGGEKLTYDMDSGQHIADYILNISAERAAGEFTTEGEIITTVYVEDTLPEGLAYIPHSGYWGGTYSQTGEGKQGEVDISAGGQQLEPQVEVRDGVTVLRWKLENVKITADQVTNIAPIYYSCDIGDVEHNDQLLNTAVIWSDGEQKKDFNEINGNLSDVSIQVIKNRAVSLSKKAEQAVVYAGESMGFVMNLGNNAGNSMEVIAMDSLPYVGDAAGSDFTGDCIVTEFTITNLKELFDGSNFRLYYTTEESERGKGSSLYADGDFTGAGSVWKELEVNGDTGEAALPSGSFQPVAIAAVGTLPAGETLKMHVTINLPEGRSGEYVANRLTEKTLESYGRSSIVGRSLEGVVWLDANENGLQEDGEVMQNGVGAVLMKLKDGGDASNPQDYEVYQQNGKAVQAETGQQINVLTGTVYDFEQGGYRFVNLPEGIFGVLFRDGTFKIADYAASPENQGEDDTIDSDAVPSYTGGKLTQAFIGSIDMPSKEELGDAEYISSHHDMGLYEAGKPVDFTFTKVKAENTDEGLNGAEFMLFSLACTDTAHDHNQLIDTGNPGDCWKLADKQTSSPQVTFKELLPGEYRLVETQAPDGRVLPSGQWKITVSEELEISITGIGDAKPPAFAEGADGALSLPNMSPADIPGSGGTGTKIFVAAGALLMGSGLLYGFADLKRGGRKRRRRAGRRTEAGE